MLLIYPALLKRWKEICNAQDEQDNLFRNGSRIRDFDDVG